MNSIIIAGIKLLDLISLIIIIKCFMTWFPGGTQNKIYELFSMLTDPIEEPIRSVMYKYMNGPIDFSPVVALLLVRLAQGVLTRMLF